jgi:NitT/TauT family transport system substrate-binding protein
MRLDPATVPALNLGRRAFRARCVLAAVSGLALLLAAGCSNSGSPGGAVSSTVIIAAIPGVSDAPLYLAQKDGLFAAEGLANVRIVPYQNQAQVMGALQNGQADIAASDYGDVFYQQAQPRTDDLRILADGYDATAGALEILTYPGSPIQSPEDLPKSSLAIGVPSDDWISSLTGKTSSQSLDVAAANQVLQSYVGNAAYSVSWKNMSQQEEINKLQSHKLQAILVSEPYIYQAESRLGAVEVLDACSGSTSGLPLLGYVALNAWVKEEPAAVADFQAAIAKAQADASLAGQIQPVLHSAAGLTIQDADLITIGSYPTSTSLPNLQTVTRLMTYEGMVNDTSSDPAVAHRLNIAKMLVKS